MRISARAFHVPKQGHTEAEYEDAFFPDGLESELTHLRCAVADGASESAFAGHWAQLLVRGFGNRQLRLAELQQQWREAIKGRTLPWFLEKKVRSGAFAAFVGLAIRENCRAAGGSRAAPKQRLARTRATDWLPQALHAEGVAIETEVAPASGSWHTERGAAGEVAGTWRALAVGDSCLFQVRDDRLVTVGPLCRSDQFNNAPHLLGSRSTEPIRRGAEHVSIHRGTWSRRDVFYLATDAIAQWLLLRQEVGLSPWEMLRALGAGDTRAFDELVGEMRAEHGLRNDDTTLLRVQVD